MSAVWHLRSGSIDEVRRAEDQWEAWDALRDRSVEEFGLIAAAERDEDGDPLLIRSSALMFIWGREADAEALIAAAVANGLPDTTGKDRATAAERAPGRGAADQDRARSNPEGGGLRV